MTINRNLMSQNNLPRLPVPPLSSTKPKLTEWILPLVDNKQFKKTRAVIDDFFKEDGVAEKLQEKLVEWNQSQSGSWLTPFWDDIYLKHRDSLPASMNFNVLLKENQNINRRIVDTAGEVSVLVTRLYHDIIDGKTKNPSIEDKRLDMSQLNKLFRSVRIPKLKRDVFYVADFDKMNNHVVLLYKNNMYKVPVTNEEGLIYNSIDISAAIELAITNELNEGVNVGVFTTAKRDEAAIIYNDLKKSELNATALQVIADALVVISIDEESANSEEAIKNLMLNEKNKYFDKTMQIIVTKYGALGFNMEHSAIDGTSVAPVISYISKGLKQSHSQVNDISQKLIVEKVRWDLSEIVLNKLKQFEKDHFKRKEEFALNPNNFTDFGAEQIKNMKISPDAFFHIALQLAQYRTFGQLKSVYEPVSVGSFYEGRTESARATSMEKRNLVEAITEGGYGEEQLYVLMQMASNAHSDRIRGCQKGLGVERHLYGLEQMYHLFGSELGIEKLPEQFRDEGYLALRHDFISTSGMAYENAEYRMFAPVVENGYGVAYFILEDLISINISSSIDNKSKGEQLMNHLVNALHELKEIAGKGQRHEEVVNWKIS